MRYFVGFMFVLALAVMGCSETLGAGGSGGSGATGGTGGIGGAGGTGGDGGAGGMPQCESAEDCDDKHACTEDECSPSDGSCEHTPVQDGSPCGGETHLGDPRGGCYAGSCNFVPVSVTVGEKEVVFDWSEDNCEDLDIPDGPARAVRAEDGEIVLFATHYTGNFLSRGGDFDTLVRVCDPPPLVSAERPTAESYENNEWLWSPYREGTRWHVLIHNEFHSSVYNSITYSVSTDGARSFLKPGAPAHVVAPAPRMWTPDTIGVEGYFTPTNIVLGPDDYYYALVRYMRIHRAMGIDVRGVCAIRTRTLDDPTSWRAWDGGGYNMQLTSPYVAGGDVPVCEFVRLPAGASAHSLTYNTYLERYMAVDEHLTWEDGKQVCGFTLSTSVDLIHWSEVQIITPARIGCDTDDTTPGQLEPVRVQYPSIIDHEDSSINFERSARTPYLYYTRHNEGFWLDRDLVRVPVKFTMGGPLCEGVDCDDLNACTEDLCNGADGSCEHAPLPDLLPCPGGFCAAGECELVEPLESCAEVLEREPTAASGIYNLNLGFDTPKPVHCEMQVEGGGWTLVGSMNGWDFCGADPLPEYDLLTDPTKTNGKISDAVVRGIRAGSGHYEVMYYLGLPGPSEYLFKHIDSYWSTLGRDPTHCTWTCADGSADSTTCGDESLGCGFGGSGSPFDTKKLYVGVNGGLHSGGGFCGLDNRLFYPVQVFVR